MDDPDEHRDALSARLDPTRLDDDALDVVASILRMHRDRYLSTMSEHGFNAVGDFMAELNQVGIDAGAALLFR